MEGTYKYQSDELSTFRNRESKESAGIGNIVIHVCDETKNVKQDFTCPRDLLISEMKYFADYLSSDADKWEDVDISVHCDVHIFDWLIRYVKHGAELNDEKPKLEHSNVISILISSDFLKMEKLVEECIRYCYRNITEIISTPCNMNCINDKLVTRIAKLFTHREVEAIQDRKDKFKSKLFCKKLEELFCPNFVNRDCQSNASTLFKCIHCEKLIIRKFRSRTECVADRTLIDSRGNLSYSHERDKSWDVNDYLLNLRSSLKTWRNVYWRIWGIINHLYCTRCEEVFPCAEYGSCSFHPQQPVFNDDASLAHKAGYFPCCNALAIRFNPVNRSKGCMLRDHLVELEEKQPVSNQESVGKNLNSEPIFAQLLANKDVICVPAKQVKSRNDGVFLTSILNPARMVPPHITTAKNSKTYEIKQMVGNEAKPSMRMRQNRIRSYEDEDQSDSDNTAIVRVVINPTNHNISNAEEKTNPTWDSSLPTRLNQDLQREDDLRRMNELLLALTRNRLEENQKGESNKSTENSQENLTPGRYHRIEQQLRSSISSSRLQCTGNSNTSVKPTRISSVK